MRPVILPDPQGPLAHVNEPDLTVTVMTISKQT